MIKQRKLTAYQKQGAVGIVILHFLLVSTSITWEEEKEMGFIEKTEEKIHCLQLPPNHRRSKTINTACSFHAVAIPRGWKPSDALEIFE